MNELVIIFVNYEFLCNSSDNKNNDKPKRGNLLVSNIQEKQQTVNKTTY